MTGSLMIGSAPYGEDVVQVGSENYAKRAKAECRRFIREIEKACGKPPEGARLFVKANPHDYGAYYTVECEFDEGNEKAYEYAYKCEGANIEEWTPETAETETSNQ